MAATVAAATAAKVRGALGLLHRQLAVEFTKARESHPSPEYIAEVQHPAWGMLHGQREGCVLWIITYMETHGMEHGMRAHAVRIFDLALSVVEMRKGHGSGDLATTALACVWIVSKLHKQSTIDCAEKPLPGYEGRTLKEFRTMPELKGIDMFQLKVVEIQIIGGLGFCLHPPTAHSFASLLLALLGDGLPAAAAAVRPHALAAIEGDMIVLDSLLFHPAAVAVAACCVGHAASATALGPFHAFLEAIHFWDVASNATRSFPVTRPAVLQCVERIVHYTAHGDKTVFGAAFLALLTNVSRAGLLSDLRTAWSISLPESMVSRRAMDFTEHL